jgi:hypothetical protein
VSADWIGKPRPRPRTGRHDSVQFGPSGRVTNGPVTLLPLGLDPGPEPLRPGHSPGRPTAPDAWGAVGVGLPAGHSSGTARTRYCPGGVVLLEGHDRTPDGVPTAPDPSCSRLCPLLISTAPRPPCICFVLRPKQARPGLPRSTSAPCFVTVGGRSTKQGCLVCFGLSTKQARSSRISGVVHDQLSSVWVVSGAVVTSRPGRAWRGT